MVKPLTGDNREPIRKQLQAAKAFGHYALFVSDPVNGDRFIIANKREILEAVQFDDLPGGGSTIEGSEIEPVDHFLNDFNYDLEIYEHDGNMIFVANVKVEPLPR